VSALVLVKKVTEVHLYCVSANSIQYVIEFRIFHTIFILSFSNIEQTV